MGFLTDHVPDFGHDLTLIVSVGQAAMGLTRPAVTVRYARRRGPTGGMSSASLARSSAQADCPIHVGGCSVDHRQSARRPMRTLE